MADDEHDGRSAFTGLRRGLIALVLVLLLVGSVPLSIDVIALREGGTIYPALSGCLAFTMSKAAAPMRVPAALWPCALYAMGLFFLAPIQVEAGRQRMRDGGLRLAALLAGVGSLLPPVISLWTVGALCADQGPFWLGNALLLGLTFGQGPRRLAVPLGVDGIGALFLFVAVTGSFFQGVLIAGSRFERVAYQAAAVENKVTAISEVVQSTHPEGVAAVPLPAAGRFPPVDRYDLVDGAAQAPLRVAIFLDLVDPVSRAQWATFTWARSRWADRVGFVVKVFPSAAACNPLHTGPDRKNACEAAVALFCAARVGDPQPYVGLLFRHQDRLGTVGATELAVEAGLPPEPFRQCVQDQGFAGAIQEDATHAGYLGINGPALFVGDRMVPATAEPEVVDAMIRHALGELPLDASGLLPVAVDVVDEAPATKGPALAVRQYFPGHIFWIDAVRNSIGEKGRRVALAGATPVQVPGLEAAKLCAAWGQRLCRDEEWVFACSGSYPVDNDGDRDRLNDRHEGRAYPYGNAYRWRACPRSPLVATGSSPGCRTPEYVYDLLGGGPEWVIDASGRLLLAGVGEGVGQTCQALTTASDGTLASFRCCQDKAP